MIGEVPPRTRESKIIEAIAEIRANNNGCWMALLALALEGRPAKTKHILGLINKNDKEISKWLRKLQR
jgi:hypothetical protein